MMIYNRILSENKEFSYNKKLTAELPRICDVITFIIIAARVANALLAKF